MERLYAKVDFFLLNISRAVYTHFAHSQNVCYNKSSNIAWRISAEKSRAPGSHRITQEKEDDDKERNAQAR